MMREITSASNPLVKELRSLATSKKARQESGTFIIEGWRGIETLLAHESRQYKLEMLVVAKGGESDPRLPDSIDTVVLPDFIFEKTSDVKNAQGILGVVRHTPAPFEFFPDTGHYLLLDAIRDPGNLGTLIRSAVGAGFDGVLLHGDCVELFNPKVIRSTMGTFAFCNIWNVSRSDIDRMLTTGYALCATTGHDGENLYETAFTKKTVLVVGSEAHGVSGELMQLATKKITIPLAKECESLNAAMAGSICMFQINCGSSCGTSRA
ncbi:MAG: RNA methyltransferase [Verrucomicrobiota bacterium]